MNMTPAQALEAMVIQTCKHEGYLDPPAMKIKEAVDEAAPAFARALEERKKVSVELDAVDGRFVIHVEVLDDDDDE